MTFRRALDFMQVARQWDIVRKVSTLSTRNMIAASRQLPLEHICLELHIAPMIHQIKSGFIYKAHLKAIFGRAKVLYM